LKEIVLHLWHNEFIVVQLQAIMSKLLYLPEQILLLGYRKLKMIAVCMSTKKDYSLSFWRRHPRDEKKNTRSVGSIHEF
jgi:hypothetical protein